MITDHPGGETCWNWSFISSPIHLLAGYDHRCQSQSHHHLLSTQSTSWLARGKASIVCWIQRLRTLNEYHLPTTTTTYHLPTIWNTSQYYSTLNEYHCCPPSTYYVEYFITLLCHIPVYHILAYFYLPPYFCPRQERHDTNTAIQIRKIIMVLI